MFGLNQPAFLSVKKGGGWMSFLTTERLFEHHHTYMCRAMWDRDCGKEEDWVRSDKKDNSIQLTELCNNELSSIAPKLLTLKDPWKFISSVIQYI